MSVDDDIANMENIDHSMLVKALKNNKAQANTGEVIQHGDFNCPYNKEDKVVKNIGDNYYKTKMKTKCTELY